MSTLNVVREEHLESDLSGNVINHNTTEETQAKLDSFKRKVKYCEKSLCCVLLKTTLEILILLAIMIYFLLIYYLEKEGKQGGILFPAAALEGTLMLGILIPRCCHKGVQQFFDSLRVVFKC
jgi:hypothetical protein